MLRERVDQALRDFLQARSTQLTAIDEKLRPLMDAASELLAGGKRLRPAFCYWAWRGARGADTDAIVSAAASLEFLQASAIVHDDVMDGSDVRRGKPSAHRRLEALHADAGWNGPPAQFGAGGAILLGDLLLLWNDEMLRGSGFEPSSLLAAHPYIDLMRTEVMAGQYLDLVNQASGNPSVESAMHVVRYKSAKYSVERPLHMGAALAGGSPELIEALSAYGLPLGEAFQLRDDILGVFGDPSVTGKPAGDDLREGKRTVLAALALKAASPLQASRFTSGLGDPSLDDDRVDEMREIIVSTGALDSVEHRIADLTEEASKALSIAPLTDEARAELSTLIRAATVRSA